MKGKSAKESGKNKLHSSNKGRREEGESLHSSQKEAEKVIIKDKIKKKWIPSSSLARLIFL